MKLTANSSNSLLLTPAPNCKSISPPYQRTHRKPTHTSARHTLLCPPRACNPECICVLLRCGSDSCQRGWRLLYILTAFHRCSEVLRPFLLKHLQRASVSAGAQYQGNTDKHTHTHNQCESAVHMSKAPSV